MRLTAIVFLVLAASLASADSQLTATGEAGFDSGELEWEPAREIVLKWSQLPDIEGTAISADYITSDVWAESADDFYCDDGAPIVSIEWWGQDFTSAGVTSFVVRFYSDVPAPPFSHPGDLLYEQVVSSWTAELVPGSNYYHYAADLPISFHQVADNVYWISIQAIHDAEGRWYWQECLESDYWNDEGTIRSEITNWVPISEVGGLYMELSFVLYADVNGPVEDTSWGHIKAMFR